MAADQLETVAGLLGRAWGAQRPVDRARAASEAARAVGRLSDVERRALVQGLVEQGAPGAAQRIAQRSGGVVAAEEAGDVARTLLGLDQDGLGRVAGQLGDPAQRQRLVEVAALSLAPPPATAPAPLPPPSGARPATAPVAAPFVAHPEPAPAEPAPAPASAPSTTGTQPTPVTSGSAAERGTTLPRTPMTGRRTAQVGIVADSVRTAPVPVVRPTRRDADPLAVALAQARTAPERWQVLDQQPDGAGPLAEVALDEVLLAVPDGWQRRTLLRRLLAAGRVGEPDDPAQLLGRWSRRGDRAAAAAMLVRAGAVQLAAAAPALDARDVERLARRRR